MNRSTVFAFATVAWACSCATEPPATGEATTPPKKEVPDTMTTTDPHEKLFAELDGGAWREVLHDPGTGDWRELWTLDGEEARIENTPRGMEYYSGPRSGDDACHAVLWTKQSFDGDVRIIYEYTRLDEMTKHVNIIYVQATGSGEGEYATDIAAWAHLRTVPSMKLYFNHMNTYHISYAAFGNKNDDPTDDYIRARRYMPESGKGLKGTDLPPDYFKTGLFATGAPHRITIIKAGDDLFMRIVTDETTKLCHWKNETLPAITTGRIGLRHMYARGARYADVHIAVRDGG